MKIKNILFGLGTFFIALLLISMVSAVQNDCANYGNGFKQGDKVILEQTCTSCSAINASIVLPDGSVNRSIIFNNLGNSYAFNFTETNQLGTYTVVGSEAWCYYFEITPSGNSGTANTVFFIFVIAILYTITFIGFFGRNIPITTLGGMAMLGLGIYTINNGIIIYRDWLTNYFSYITMAIGFILAIWAIIEWIMDELG